MELFTLGTGSLLDRGRALSSFVLDRKVLFEAPPDVTTTLQWCALERSSLETIVISHLHGDHYAGLPFLLAQLDTEPDRGPPLTIVGPPNLEQRTDDLMELLLPGSSSGKRRERRYVEVGDGDLFETPVARGTARAVVHTDDGVLPLGVRVEVGDCVLAYTGDTEWCDVIFELADGADVLIADCTHRDPRRSAGHMSYEDVLDLRGLLPLSTTIVLSHLGHDPPEGTVAGIVIPDDGEALVFPDCGATDDR